MGPKSCKVRCVNQQQNFGAGAGDVFLLSPPPAALGMLAAIGAIMHSNEPVSWPVKLWLGECDYISVTGLLERFSSTSRTFWFKSRRVNGFLRMLAASTDSFLYVLPV